MAMAGDEVFDPVQMRALYALGVRMATSGNAWFSQPPGQPQ
jgi:hypothetical protein